MKIRDFARTGHWPTLLAAFLYFDISFMIWVILGPLAPFATESLRLSAAEKGFLVAVPLLAGSFFRPILGAIADRIGGRNTGLIGMAATLAPLLLGWLAADSYSGFLGIGVLLGIAGASFAVALPLASRWYPPEYQGLAMGIAGAGNSGTLLATLFAPRLASAFEWKTVFGLAVVPLVLVGVLFAILAKESPTARKTASWSDYKALLREPDTAWFCFFYSVTFGGFVGFASFLTVFFVDQYQFTKVGAGDLATLCVVAGSFVRPVGGWLSDRIGGYRLLLGVYLMAGFCVFFLSSLPIAPLAAGVLVLTMATLGLGNGAVFQLIPQRFAKTVGLVTGIVGAAGGLGGFFLPSMMGLAKEQTGNYSAGLLGLGVVTWIALLSLLARGNAWSSTWDESARKRAGVVRLRNPIASVASVSRSQ